MGSSVMHHQVRVLLFVHDTDSSSWLYAEVQQGLFVNRRRPLTKSHSNLYLIPRRKAKNEKSNAGKLSACLVSNRNSKSRHSRSSSFSNLYIILDIDTRPNPWSAP